MKHWARVGAVAVGGLAAGAAAAAAAGGLLWDRDTARAVRRLGSAATGTGAGPARLEQQGEFLRRPV